MPLKTNFILLCSVYIIWSGANEIKSNSSILKFMTQTSSLMQESPARSMNCFDIYIPIINDIALEFEQSYKQCLITAENDYAEAENATLGQQQDLSQRAQDTCDLLNACEGEESALDNFECHASAGLASAKSLYKISSDASIHLSDLRGEFRLIDRQQQICTSKAERVYNEKSDKAFDDLNKCIMGTLPVPSIPSNGVSVHVRK